MVGYTFKPSTRETEQEGFCECVCGQLCLYSEFQASQGYIMRPSPISKKKMLDVAMHLLSQGYEGAETGGQGWRAGSSLASGSMGLDLTGVKR